MSKRYGGRFSPDRQAEDSRDAAPSPLSGARPSRLGARVNLLFVAPFAFVLTAFFQPPAGLLADLGAFLLLMLAAWLTREGERAHEAWDARRIARRPAVPRKAFAAVLTGAGIALGAWSVGGSVVMPLLMGLLGSALHVVAFGLDPMRDKGMDGVDRSQTERVATAIAEAQAHIDAMTSTIARLGDRPLADKVARFAATARGMFRRVEDDPRDLTAARRYLSVYLNGAREATDRFAALYTRNRDADARSDYEALLDDLDRGFADKAELLLSNDRSALDVEIEVLRERLAQEAGPR